MGTLSDDLAQYSGELFSKRDLHAGFKIIAELTGAVTVVGFTFTALTSWLPAIGIPIATQVAMSITETVGRHYMKMSTEDRKAVRAVVRWCRGGFTLGDHFVD
jgi:hypothetical protein